MVRIVSSQTATPINIVAPMPDQFVFDTAATYEAPFAQGLFGNGLIANIARLGGLSLTSQALTAQLWQGSSETQLSVDLEFQAEFDPISEVRDQILKLMKLTTPSRDAATGMIRSPGPQLNTKLAGEIALEGVKQFGDTLGVPIDAALQKFGLINPETDTTDGSARATTKPSLLSKAGLLSKIENIISIQIGRFAFFDAVVITNVQQTYTSQIDANTGFPMHARVTVQFKPLFLLLQEDLDNIFVSQGSNAIPNQIGDGFN